MGKTIPALEFLRQFLKLNHSRMNTPTHILISMAALGEPNDRTRNAVAFTGAILPDSAIFLLWGGARILGYGERAVWGDLYEHTFWQEVIAIGNSIPVYLSLIGLSCLVLKFEPRLKPCASMTALFSLSALLHIAFDVPFHAGDAHRHFWPLSDWRFYSPISYWDDDHHGNVIRILELAIAVLLSAVLWKRFKNRLARGIIAFNLALYVIVPLYFVLTLG